MNRRERLQSLRIRKAAREAARSAAAGAASPRPVTRGESRQPAGASIDWLNVTFPCPARDVSDLVERVGHLLRRPVSGVSAGGRLGFAERVDLNARVGSRCTPIGCIAFGGGQGGRWLLQLTGVGCQMVPDWAAFQELLVQLRARITRVDLAVDVLDGAVDVDCAVDWYDQGLFTKGGRPPSSSVAGDWLGGQGGRTFYVGNSSNGKLLRVYEKGKQLGNVESEWVRFEVQIGNRDRDIPFDVLTDPTRYFCGSYPALCNVIAHASEGIPTFQTGAETTVANLLHHLRRSYGKAVDLCITELGASFESLVEEVRVIGWPRRVNPVAVQAAATWAGTARTARSYR